MKRSFFMSQFFLLIVLFSILIVVGSFIDKSKPWEVKNSQIKYPSTQPPLTSSIPSPTQIITQLLDTPLPTSVQATPIKSEPTHTTSSDQLTYPNSQKITNNTYTTPDNPQTVTKWYQEKFKDLNLNVTSIVETSSNDNVFNKLSGTNGNISITVEIKKGANDAVTKIELTIYKKGG